MKGLVCVIPSCDRVTYVDYDCYDCGTRYCHEHDNILSHRCWEQRNVELGCRRQKTTELVLELMLATREKIPQDFPGYTVGAIPNRLIESGYNIHLPVISPSGGRWMAGIRYTDRGDAAEIATFSAAATMKFLEGSNAFVPKVLLPPNFKDYYLTEFILGQPGELSFNITDFHPSQLKPLFRDFASHFIAIASRPTKGIGSLQFHPSTKDFSVGALVEKYPPLDNEPFYLGPFQTTLDRYNAKIDDILACLDRESVISSRVIERYLMHLEIRRIINMCDEMCQVETGHFVLHGESVGSQFMLKDGRLTGVLDWDWSYTTTKAEAFAGACLFFDNEKFFEGSNELSAAEVLLVEAYEALGRPDMADCVRRGKKYQRLWTMVGQRPELASIKGLQDAFGVAVDTQKTLEDWCTMAKDRFKENQGLSGLIKRL